MREDAWTDAQKQLYNARIAEKLAKGKHKHDFTAQQIKLYNGEVHVQQSKNWQMYSKIIKTEEKIVITELKYYRDA